MIKIYGGMIVHKCGLYGACNLVKSAYNQIEIFRIIIINVLILC